MIDFDKLLELNIIIDRFTFFAIQLISYKNGRNIEETIRDLLNNCPAVRDMRSKLYNSITKNDKEVE